MSVRRLLFVLSVWVVASATVVAAAPQKSAPKGPVAPAKDAAGSGSAAGSAAGSDTSDSPAPPDEPPPKDMNGVDENPDQAKTVGSPDTSVVVPPPATRPAGYPIEETLRPITLPANMSELSIAPHAQFSPVVASDALRARYGITRQVQLGLTYVYAGIYNDPLSTSHSLGVHAGKAVGLDVTVLLANWIGVKVGVPVYIQPVAFSLQLGVPLKFTFGDKLALGGLDDLLNIKLYRFPVSFNQELFNAQGAALDQSGSTQSAGVLRISAYGIYQYQPNVAIIGRFGFDDETLGQGQNDNGAAGTATFLRAGIEWTPRNWIDLGISLGFDDLGHLADTFGPQGYLAIRI